MSVCRASPWGCIITPVTTMSGSLKKNTFSHRYPSLLSSQMSGRGSVLHQSFRALSSQSSLALAAESPVRSSELYSELLTEEIR